MDTANRTLLKLADPTTRAALLGSSTLLELVALCYDVDTGTAVGGVTPVFDRFDLAVALPPQVGVSGRMSRVCDAQPWEFTAVLDRLLPPEPAADAVWAGDVVIRIPTPDGIVDDVAVQPPDRNRVPGWGAGGAESTDLLVHLTAPTAPAATSVPLVLPVLVAFVIAEDGTTPLELLRRTAEARRVANGYRAALRPVNGPPRKAESCVCWLVPASLFDDTDWPGAAGGDAAAQRAARLAAARAWLAGQSVAVVTT